MQEMVLNVSLVAIAAGLFRMLIPDSTFKKQIAFLVACFFAVSTINVFKNGSIDISALSQAMRQEGVYTDFSAQEYQMTQTEIAQRLSDSLKEKLEAEEIYPENIFVIVDISGSFSISIIEIRLVFSAQQAELAANAEEKVKEEVGDEIKVVSEIKA